eukprot:SAG11_NODE_224_length_12103_cov_8.087054_6_plen_224_part_00
MAAAAAAAAKAAQDGSSSDSDTSDDSDCSDEPGEERGENNDDDDDDDDDDDKEEAKEPEAAAAAHLKDERVNQEEDTRRMDQRRVAIAMSRVDSKVTQLVELRKRIQHLQRETEQVERAKEQVELELKRERKQLHLATQLLKNETVAASAVVNAVGQFVETAVPTPDRKGKARSRNDVAKVPRKTDVRQSQQKRSFHDGPAQAAVRSAACLPFVDAHNTSTFR